MRLFPIFRRARAINKSLGARTAAGYLRNQGVSLEVALFLIVGR